MSINMVTDNSHRYWGIETVEAGSQPTTVWFPDRDERNQELARREQEQIDTADGIERTLQPMFSDEWGVEMTERPVRPPINGSRGSCVFTRG